jgi:hypothetical protein
MIKLMRFLGIAMAVAALLASAALAGDCPLSPGFEGLNTAVKGFPVPRTSPVQGVDYLDVEQVAGLIESSDHVFIDVRPAGFFKACRLKGSTNLEYTFAGEGGEAMYKSGPRLTREALEAYLQDGKTAVLFCNDAFSKTGCHRAANAAITAVCTWGLPGERIKWFGDGVSGSVAQMPELTSGSLCRKPWH